MTERRPTYESDLSEWERMMQRNGWRIAARNLLGEVVEWHHELGATIKGRALIDAWERRKRLPPPW